MQKKIRVLTHYACFMGSTTPYYFIKVVNCTKKDLEITHVWLKASPDIHVMHSERPLPYRLKPNETWETWVEEVVIRKALDICHYNLARVRLSAGNVYSSEENKDIPIEGYVANPNLNS